LRQFEQDHVQSGTGQSHSTTRQDEEGESTSLNRLSSQETQDHGPLAGKKAIITGASRGIGAAIAQRFAKEGARCVLIGRNVDALAQVREGLIGPSKADHVVRVGDVGSLEFWKDVARSEVSA
jgi:FlaA1/EpsC-like NDP-sugar epimerase